MVEAKVQSFTLRLVNTWMAYGWYIQGAAATRRVVLAAIGPYWGMWEWGLRCQFFKQYTAGCVSRVGPYNFMFCVRCKHRRCPSGGSGLRRYSVQHIPTHIYSAQPVRRPDPSCVFIRFLVTKDCWFILNALLSIARVMVHSRKVDFSVYVELRESWESHNWWGTLFPREPAHQVPTCRRRALKHPRSYGS